MTIRSGGRPRDGRAPRPARTTRTPTRPRPCPRFSEPSRGAVATAAARRSRRRLPGHPQVPDLRARPGGDRPGRGADRAAADRQRRDPGHGRGQPGRASSCRSSRTSSREDLGTALTTPGLDRPGPGRVRRRDGDTARDDREPARGRGLPRRQRAFVFIAIDRDLTGELQQGTFILRKNLTPDQLVTALLAPPEVPYVDIALRTGLRLEQITAKLETSTALEMDPQEFYELVDVAAGRAARRLSLAQEDPRGRARRAPRSKGSCGRRPTACCPTRRPRSWSA